jgi:hypothetical protein
MRLIPKNPAPPVMRILCRAMEGLSLCVKRVRANG